MKKEIKLVGVSCPLCGAKNNYQVIFRSNFSLADFNKDIYSARRLPDRIHYQLVKCLNDGLVRSTPVLAKPELLDLYRQSFFNYEDETRELTQSYLKVLKKVLEKLPETAKILEVGCGNGFLLKELQKMGFKNVFGVEVSLDAVKKADQTLAKNIFPEDLVASHYFRNGTLDFIFLFQTFDHLTDPSEFLPKVYQLLKKGGYFLTLNHNFAGISVKLFGERSPIVDIEHTFYFTPRTLKLLVEKQKFKVLECFSPTRIIAFRKLFRFLPLPSQVKKIIVESKKPFLDRTIELKLGNLCLIARK